MQISKKGIELIKRFEGCELTAYKCPAGVWTIGYGWTRPVDGKPIAAGMKIDIPTAERLLRAGVVSYEQDVSRMVKATINQNQFDALVSLAYNIGPRALSTSTLMLRFNEGNYKAAADQFLVWNKGGGKILPGLTKRREAERALFLS